MLGWAMLALTMGCARVLHAQETQPGDSGKLLKPQDGHPVVNPQLPTLWIIGDSTVRNGQDTGGNGQWGWGNPIRSYFDETKINIQNRAMGGTSSRTFYRDLWPAVLSEIKAGDYLIMQFGHNDGGAINEPPGPKARARASIKGNGDEVQEIDNQLTGKHEVVHSYGWYLRTYVKEAKAKGAAGAVICSPIPRNRFKDGKIGLDGLAKPGEEAAKQVEAAFLNLNERIVKKYEAAGEQKVTEEYFPEKETIHTDWAGAVLNAETVIEGLKDLNSPLVKFLKSELPKDLKNPTGKAR